MELLITMRDFHWNSYALYCCLFIPVLLSFTIYIIAVIIRPKFAIKVNCWFCNKDSNVPYGNRNCWDCPFCEQYNGFDENEDYNKPIPAQYDELLNHSSRWESEKECLPAATNGLCETCNGNQLLKIKQLATFVPQHNKTFDEEVEIFKKQLDSAYKLCHKCEVVLHQKLGQQDLNFRGKVFSWKLQQQQKNKPSHKQFFPGVPKFIRCLQLSSFSIITFVCVHSISMLQKETQREIVPLNKIIPSAVLAYLAETKLICSPEFSLLGFFLLIIAILSAGKNRLRVIDAFTSLTWLLMLFVQLPITTALFTSLEARLITQYLVSFLGTVLTAACIFCCRPPSVVGGSWKRKGSNNSLKSLSDMSNYSPSTDDQTSIYDDSYQSEKCLPQFPASYSNMLQDSRISTTTRGKMAYRNLNCESPLDSHLQAMKISTPKKSQNLSGVFTKRIYSSQSPLLSGSNSTNGFQRNVLSPARLKAKTITHSSWVGGGYWANANPHSRSLFTGLPSGQFSRGLYVPPSSSYSCPTSRNGSVIGDDKVSVHSEPGHLRNNPFSCSEKSYRKSLSPTNDLEQIANNSTISSDSSRSRSSEIEASTPLNTFSQHSAIQKNDASLWRITYFRFFLGFSIAANVILISYVCSSILT